MLYHKTFELGPDRDWVVFVHGAGGSSSIWFKQLRAYREHFNVLLLDLRGHGQSNQLQQVVKGHYSFRAVTEDILRLLDHLRIPRAHFVGISLGTILIRHLAELCPERVKSMVLGGAILRLDIRSRVLVQLGRVGQHILPYMWLYRLFAFIIMPRQHHQESRNLFVREARKLCQKEFKRWFRLATEVNPLMRYFKERALPIPTLYVMQGGSILCWLFNQRIVVPDNCHPNLLFLACFSGSARRNHSVLRCSEQTAGIAPYSRPHLPLLSWRHPH